MIPTPSIRRSLLHVLQGGPGLGSSVMGEGFFIFSSNLLSAYVILVSRLWDAGTSPMETLQCRNISH